MNFTGVDGQINLMIGDEVTKAFGDLARFQQRDMFLHCDFGPHWALTGSINTI